MRIVSLAGWVFVVVVSALLASAPEHAEACSCIPPPPPAEALQRMGAVFEGRVVSVAPDAERMRLTARVQVLRRWKGANATEVEVATAGDSAMCGVSLEEGRTYLLYADAGADGTAGISVSLCSRTTGIEQAAADLAALGAPLAASPPAPPAAGDAPGTGGTGGTSAPSEPSDPPPAATPTPRSGGCAGCGGAAAGLALVLGTRRRRA